MEHQKRKATDSPQGSSHGNKSRALLPAKEGTDFVEGSIVRIKLVKFLTYDEVEFKTGPSLNVIIGPNGTGKSAIVCAICLGLAGKTSWLGRATDPKDFIKYGAQSAKTEIELFNPFDECNYVVTREISHNKASHWWINKRTSTQKAVEELVAKLNIQVGNLCQFLPQEKVAEFARMSMQELLENTEKSVCRDNMFENHQLLKTARREARGMEEDLKSLEDELDQKRQKNIRLEEDVKSYHDRKKFLEKVEILKLKKPWLESQLLKEQYERAKEERDRKFEELLKEKKQTEALQKKQNELRVRKEDVEKETRQMSKIILSKTKDVEEQKTHLGDLAEKMEQENNEFKSKLKEEEGREYKLAALQEQFRALEQQLSDMVRSNNEQEIAHDLEQVARDLREVNLQMTNVQTQGEQLVREINVIKNEIRSNEARLHEIRNVNNRRLETLRTLHQHTYEAVVWLRENKNQFSGTIHEPLIISLNVTNPQDAKLVESHISFNDLKSFVCENPDDLELFMHKMKNELRLRVNAIKAPTQPASSFKPQHPISRYSKYGFQRYMQQLFTCPEPVMRYLCLMYNVHRIPVGSQAIKNNTERISTECPELISYYAPDVQYSVKRSKYSKNVSHRNTALKEPRAFTDSVNVEREQELTNQNKESLVQQKAKEDEYKILQNESDKLLKEINELREKKRSLMKQKDQRKALETQIKTKKQKMEFINSEKLNVEEEKERLHVQLKKIVKEKLKNLDKIKCLSGDCVELAQKRVERSLRLAECSHIFYIADAELQKARHKLEGLEREVKELKDHVKDTKEQAQRKIREAKQAAGIGPNDEMEEKLVERGVWQDFQNAPDRLQDLENEIYSMQARAEAMFMVDEEVIRDYKQREKDIKRLEERLSARESEHQLHHDKILETKKKWHEDLRKLIEEINQNFSYFFSCLQCCGEVGLSVPENPDDYEKYGVCIKVKFRDHENLRELTAHHQSGGERSVSTVLYMMALQELSKCPFRCVDEINQGMDPKNERKIFELVVQTVCKRSCSQYFLLTPKLLPDLEYDENMTVLCVYNGPGLMKHDKWNLSAFLERRAAIED